MFTSGMVMAGAPNITADLLYLGDSANKPGLVATGCFLMIMSIVRGRGENSRQAPDEEEPRDSVPGAAPSHERDRQ